MDRLTALPLKLLVICDIELGIQAEDSGVPFSPQMAYKLDNYYICARVISLLLPKVV